MKLQYCSDLHLEFELNEKLMKKYPLQVKGDILLLAGDIVPFGLMDKHRYFFDFVADNFAHTYWLPGNHEYYHTDIKHRSGVLHEEIRGNVSLVNNVSLVQGGVQLIFSTLWSRIDPVNEWAMERALSDFHVIKDNGLRFSVPAFNALHEDSMVFVRQALADNADGRKVVVSHHVPTLLHYPEKYRKSALNEAFATELGDMIADSSIHSWIYGHHHCNTPTFKIGNTNMLTNQLGYVKHGEHRDFDTGKLIVDV